MGSVPLIFEGAKYRGGIVHSIPPLFSSAEIGDVNAYTLNVTFDQSVSASDYAAGVTIKINGTATSITSATRQNNHAIVRYVIPVLWHGSADVVTWEYASASGNIVAESGGAALGNVSAQAATNNCEYAALMDLQADTLVLNDGDPVSTWADLTPNGGHDFTQSGTARPTKQIVGGYPVVIFDGVNDWLLGGDFSDNLSNFSVVAVLSLFNPPALQIFLSKLSGESQTGAGWGMTADQTYSAIFWWDEGIVNWINIDKLIDLGTDLGVSTFEKLDNSQGKIYRNGADLNADLTSGGTVVNFSSSEPVRLGTSATPSEDHYWHGQVGAIILFSPIPNATNRAALEVRLAARYGITL